MHGIKDKVALVTGAGSGIGRATAIRFAEEGAKVVVADVAKGGLEETVKLIEKRGGKAIAVVADVTDEADVKRMVKVALDNFDRLDFAHNNAGIEGTQKDITEVTEADWQKVIDVNLKGVFLGMKHEIPAMKRHGGGAIVNTASVAGLVGFGNLYPYVASKHGVVGLTRAAALDHSREGVRVNAVCPGVIKTPMVQRVLDEDPNLEKSFSEGEPIGRLGEPEEIANSVVWLCSDEASFITGHALANDGGWVAQ